MRELDSLGGDKRCLRSGGSMLNYLYDDEAERQIHLHAMEILRREITLPEEEIKELYERELERLKKTARVCRAVRDTLLRYHGQEDSDESRTI